MSSTLRPESPTNDDSSKCQSSGRTTSFGLREAAVKTAIDGDDPILRSMTVLDPCSKPPLPHETFPMNLPRPKSLFNKNTMYTKPNIVIKSEPPAGKLTAARTIWKVPNSSLRCVPDRFILARSHRYVGSTSASTVSARISDILYNRSIHVSYNNELATAKCKNADLASYSINLYSGRGEYNHGVIVEVLRLGGDCFSFQKDCRAILDAAEGEEDEFETFTYARKRICEMNFFKELEDSSLEKEAQDVLDNACAFVEGNTIDLHLHGLQSLRVLTDSTKTSSRVALYAAKNILSNDNSVVLPYIASLAKNEVHSTVQDITGGNPFKESLCNTALCVLSNSLEVTASSGDLINIIKELPTLIEHFVPMLVKVLTELKNDKVCPHMAVHGVKSLSILCNVSQDAKMKAQETGAILMLEEAVQYGIGNHKSLAEESKRCISTLNCH